MSEIMLTIGQVSKRIRRTAQTIKHWYEWAEENNKMHELPEMHRKGPKGIRYFKESDIPKLEEFRDKIQYGMMSDYNVKNWGRRGNEIQERKG